MGVRGQNNEAWMSRWRAGTCPVHGKGFVEDATAPAEQDAGFFAERCPEDECDVRVARWPAHDAHHASFGWRAGPEKVRALLIKANDVDPNGPTPGTRARVVRTSYALEPDKL
jgi:hypothetical protein